MYKSFYFFLIVFVSFNCFSQEIEKTKLGVIDCMNSITENDLKEHLYVIASDKMQGRETGSKGQKKAGKYLINFYTKNKINFPQALNSYYQKVPSKFLNAKGSDLKNSENILAFIEGTEKPNEIIIISAHYDHIGTIEDSIYNGADDDGSGTVALLEIAQAFKIASNKGLAPKRSILIFHATGEEHGLLGSKFYSENPVFSLSNTIADINIDMIGRRDENHAHTNNYVYVIGADKLSSELDAICKSVNETFLHLDLDYTFNNTDDPNRFYYRSDHYNFAKNGIPSVFFFNGVHDDYHKASDTADKIEYDALKKRTQLAFLTAWELANRKDRIKIDRNEK